MTRHRSPDWSRLKASGLFDIEDKPGLIVVRQPAGDIRKPILAVGAFWLLGFLLPRWLGPLGLIAGWMMTLIALVGTVVVWRALSRQALEVRFTAAGVEFIRLFGRSAGIMGREGMQQIAMQKNARGLYFHRFMADTGYFNAFASQNEAQAVLRNNLLIAAYRQPLHLDGAKKAAAHGRARWAA